MNFSEDELVESMEKFKNPHRSKALELIGDAYVNVLDAREELAKWQFECSMSPLYEGGDVEEDMRTLVAISTLLNHLQVDMIQDKYRRSID